VDVELLVVADCANENRASHLLRTALDEVGLAHVVIVTSVIRTLEEAEARGFCGSPTFRINGVDQFTEPGSVPALACRVYRTGAWLAGVPELSALRRALSESAESERIESERIEAVRAGGGRAGGELDR
jgi:hypothetical protein